jgi:Cu2+-exporting ATPase
MFAAAAMSLSSFCVVSNALRLNFCKIYGKKHDESQDNHNNNYGPAAQSLQAEKKGMVINNNIKEKKIMKKTMKIEGMMCGHCEARVKKALEAIDGVDEAIVSHQDKSAVVTLNAEVSDEVLRQAVEAQDYQVISVQ